MRRAGPRGEHLLRTSLMTLELVFLDTNPYPCGRLPPCRTGLGRSLVGYRCLRVDPRTYLVPNVDLSSGIPGPPQLNGLSRRWFGKILDE